MDKEYILENIKGRATSKYIKCHYPEEYKNIMSLPGEKFAEKLYNYFYKCPTHKCPVCGKNTPFRSITYGFSTFCSVKCSYKSDIRISKIKSTCLDKYGVDNPSKSDIVQEKKKETCLKNYGVEIPLASEELKNKFKSTCLDKYGVDNPSKSDIVQEKKKETCLKNYGVEYGVCIDGVLEKSKSALISKYGVESIFLLKSFHEAQRNKFIKSHHHLIGYDDDGNWICKCPHQNCNECSDKQFIIPQQVYNDRSRLGSELCTKLLPVGLGFKYTNIETFVTKLLDEYQIEYMANVRGIIDRCELDIYIPSKKLAIECNGVYWHSSNNKYNTYHINKHKKCSEQNIQLVTVWEDWVKNKPHIIKSIILSKLGLHDNRIYARKCIIKEIDNKLCSDFLQNNHIQGKSPSTIKIGLYYENLLVSVMTFKNQKNKVILSRFCNKVGYQIIGGASKLLKYFIKNYNPSIIVSYSSNDISNGNLYNELGFISDKKTSPSYWYISHGDLIRYHRETFQKCRLKQLGYDTDNNTEFQIMDKLPYFRIHDTGTLTWIWKKEP